MESNQNPPKPPAPSTPQIICPSCKAVVSSNAYYCFNCGKKIKDKPPSTGVMTQLGIYALSILLPPFGIIPAIRYLQQKDGKARAIGWVALILTIIISSVTLYYSFVLYKELTAMLNSQLDLNQLKTY